VAGVLKLAEEKHLVCQPFDFGKGYVGVCFCCDDCCYLFNPKPIPCNKGTLIESTDKATCINCGKCVKVCYFGARAMKGARLRVNRRRCSGCGLCTDVCPVDAVTMVKRG